MKKNVKLWQVDICFVESIFVGTLISSKTLKEFYTMGEAIELCILDYLIKDLGYTPTEISEVRIQPYRM